VQALGGGVTMTVATAIVRDVYVGKKQEAILAIVQSMTMICPVVAPLIGAAIMSFADWRGIFYAQAVFGAIVTVGTFVFSETLQKLSGESALRSFGRLWTVAKNPAFSVLIPIFNLASVGLMAFVSSSAYIFQDSFLVSPQAYSRFFSINAAGMVCGPLLYIMLVRRFSRRAIVNGCFVAMALSGAFVAALGAGGPWLFSFLLLPASLAGSCLRPPGTFLMMSMHNDDIGAASSIVTFSGVMLGSVGMILAALLPIDMIVTIGAANAVLALASGGMWLRVSKRL
jgi:DHA1 family bicyclomycin/chloramphenicol resistance-like MFS transporter